MVMTYSRIRLNRLLSLFCFGHFLFLSRWSCPIDISNLPKLPWVVDFIGLKMMTIAKVVSKEQKRFNPLFPINFLMVLG